MLLRLEGVLTPDQLRGARELLARVKFVDGKASAGMAAVRVKNNLEADRQATEIHTLDNLVMGSLVQHPVYRAGAPGPESRDAILRALHARHALRRPRGRSHHGHR